MRGPNADEIFKAPMSGNDAASMAADIKGKHQRLELFQSESHRMKSLMMSSASIRSTLVDGAEERALNPLWVNFPTKCVKPIASVEEMKEKLEYFSHTDELMVVRYHQNNCTACNAVDKVFEVLCHQSIVRLPGLHFYEINKNEVPELAKGLVRFPQIKGFSGGQWSDIDFKPHSAFREELYAAVEREVRQRKNEGTPVTAIQAEEMYYSGAGPAMLMVTEENVVQFYRKAQERLHNYWKQVSVRRSWFFKKFISPEVDEALKDEWRTRSIFGEKIVYGPENAPGDFTA